MLKKILAASVLLLLFCTASYSATKAKTKSKAKDQPAKIETKEESILARWSHENNFSDKDGDQTFRIKATYYSNEYIEALVASEAEKNLWTADETENYKYTLLKDLNLDDSIAFRIEMYVRGIPMYPNPFDKHISMRVGKKVYQPSAYDQRFNFKVLGARDGMVYFPRYDPKTGKDILEGAKDIRVIFDHSISMAMSSGSDLVWVWDLTKDRGKIGGGKAANRLEVDRLIRRSDKIAADRAELLKQLEALNKEYDDVNSRIDELQAQ